MFYIIPLYPIFSPINPISTNKYISTKLSYHCLIPCSQTKRPLTVFYVGFIWGLAGIYFFAFSSFEKCAVDLPVKLPDFPYYFSKTKKRRRRDADCFPWPSPKGINCSLNWMNTDKLKGYVISFEGRSCIGIVVYQIFVDISVSPVSHVYCISVSWYAPASSESVKNEIVNFPGSSFLLVILLSCICLHM